LCIDSLLSLHVHVPNSLHGLYRICMACNSPRRLLAHCLQGTCGTLTTAHPRATACDTLAGISGVMQGQCIQPGDNMAVADHPLAIACEASTVSGTAPVPQTIHMMAYTWQTFCLTCELTCQLSITVYNLSRLWWATTAKCCCRAGHVLG
jgi:hypothetical protein